MIVSLDVILIATIVMLGIGLVAVASWFLYTAYLTRRERRLAVRKGLYRDLVSGLATRERALLEPAIRQLGTLHDLEALEAVLEEQARNVTDRPAWLLDTYDRLGLVDKYADRLRHSRRWRERAFAAELLGRVGNAKAVAVLLETAQATKTEDADVREIALRALARIADPRAVEPLVAALRQAEGWLAPRLADILARHGELVVEPMIALLETAGRLPARAWAANVLGELRAARAFPALARALGDLDDEVRAKSATALGRLGDRRAVTYLLDHLLSDPAPFVRARIAAALGQFDDPEVIDRLVRALGDAAWWVRMRSVEALEQIGAGAEGPLLLALEDADPEIRIRSAVALERLGVPGRLVRMIEADDRAAEARRTLVKFAAAGARELLAELLLHPAPAVRLAVIEAVRRAGRRDLAGELVEVAATDAAADVRTGAFDALRTLEAREAVPGAITALGDPSETVRAAALALVGELGDGATAAEIRARTHDPEWSVRAAAARALARVRTEAAPDLLRLLADPQPAVRAAAAEAAGRAGLRSLVPDLVTLLGDADAEVRRTAVEALGQLGDAAAVPALRRSFRDAPAALRETITLAVARLDPRALPELVALLLAGGDVGSKLAVIATLEHAGAAEPVAAEAATVLEALAGDPSPAVRAGALDALGGLRCPAAAARAAAALGDPDDRVRASAVNALVRVGEAARAPALDAALLALVGTDPSALVRERAALATGLLRLAGGERALAAVCRADEPLAVRAAALLALGAFDEESLVARALAMGDEAALRDRVRERVRHDAEYRLLARRVRETRSLELRALVAENRAALETSLAEGLRSTVDVRERLRLVAGLHAVYGERSRGALAQVVRGDPSAEVRAAALQALGSMLEGEALATAARRALGDPSALVRRTGAALFARLPAAEALPALLAALRPEDDAELLRAVAAQAEAEFDTFAALARQAAGEEGSARGATVVARLARWITQPAPAVLAALVRPLAAHAAPEVRRTLAALWAARPELADAAGLERLVADPVVAVRREALEAATALRRDDLVAALAEDPDEEMRAAAYVARLLHGDLIARPADVPHHAAASAVAAGAAGARLEELRTAARTAPEPRRRLSAAIALALVDDAVAHEVAAADPVPAIRTEVAAALAQRAAEGGAA
ncbi:MAG TPA: HEAT repeat domain-containing protein [Gemmatimonadales bacterium]|nr:HEAT repeat domain-containing protein [Gemmatimonadales bacterium]